jgi:hypothetical protein
MVNVDTVYQRVLTIANKEQRGYITPLEFNLLANQAQLSIFEDYFTQLNQAVTIPGNEGEYSDVVKTLNEKISLFKTRSGLIYNNGYFTYPSDMHKLGTLYYRPGGSSIEKAIEVQEINPDELMDYNKSPLTSPTRSRPIYIRSMSGIEIFSKPSIANNIETSYIKRPSKVEWGYVVTNEQALYNASSSTDFELHDSEETILVMKILGLAGIVMQKPDLAGAGATE